MGQKKIITLSPASWSPEAERWLIGAVDQLADVRASVESGAATLFHVGCDGELCGAFVLRLDRFALHDEGVIVAAGASVPGVCLAREVLPAIERKFPTAKTIRIHTRRRGLVRQLARAGYAVDEIILRKPAGMIRQPCQQQQGGGGGSSSSATTDTKNIDKRLVVDAGTGVSADQSTVTVNTLDAGAIAGALEFGAKALDGVTDLGENTSKYALDLSALSVDKVFGLADTVLKGAYGTIDKNAQLIERTGSFVDKAYADAKGSGAERFYIAVGVVAAVVIVAVNVQKK